MKQTLLVSLLLALVAGNSLAANPTDAVQARKELNAMGLSYGDQAQFLKALKSKDEIAIDLFIQAKGIDLNATSYSVIGIAYQTQSQSTLNKLLAAGALPRAADITQVINGKDKSALFMMLKAQNLQAGVLTPQAFFDAVYHMPLEKSEFIRALSILSLEVLQAATDPSVVAASMERYKDVAALEEFLRRLGSKASQVINSPTLKASNWKGRRLLSFAVTMHSKEFDIIPLLVKHGADVNAVDPVMTYVATRKSWQKQPATALIMSAYWPSPEATKSLLSVGADPNIVVVQDGGGIFAGAIKKRSALSTAEEASNDTHANFEQRKAEVLHILETAGAKRPEDIEKAQSQRSGSFPGQGMVDG